MAAIAGFGFRQADQLFLYTSCDTPFVSFEGGTTGFGWFFADVAQLEQTLPASVDLSWQKGNHNFKFGVQYLSNVTPQRNADTSSGAHSFRNRGTGLPGFGATGVGYASFLLGEVDSLGLNSPRAARFSNNTLAFFMQDSWRATPKLTLNYGVRWDFFLPMKEGYDRIANTSLTTPNPGADGTLGALVFYGDGPGRNGRTGVWDTYKKAISPRFGLAYSLNNQTVVRASYGISTSALLGLYGSGMRVLTTGFMNVRANQATTNQGVTPLYNWNDGVPGITGIFSGALPNLDPALANGINHGIIFPGEVRPALNQNINFGIERNLGQGLIVRADYIGLLARHLPSDSHIELNQMPLSALSLGSVLNTDIGSQAARAAGITRPYPSFEGSVAQALRPFPQFQRINNLSSPTATMNYHSLQASAQKRFGGLNFLFAYTISKTLGTGGGFGAQGQSGGQAHHRRLAHLSHPQLLGREAHHRVYQPRTPRRHVQCLGPPPGRRRPHGRWL